ncbi:MAG: IPTL-CTERM sorting domain-containing protein [Candidatus Competibacteraceae bacterium]|nr:MAG: IPTL-CTERM sorting domain-containing protein [Candidatus Competibacteraceae bacterium]
MVADGDIEDQGGPGVASGTTSIPTLGEWALILFSILLGGLVWRWRTAF